MGITNAVRELMGDDSGGRTNVGLGLGIYPTEFQEFLVSTAETGFISVTTGVTNVGGKAMIGRMNNRRFVEAKVPTTGTSVSKGLSATVGLRF